MKERSERSNAGTRAAHGDTAASPARERRGLWGRVRLFVRFALRRGTVLRAVKLACVVTPILTVFNHSREILALRLDLAFWTQVALTFLVPYGVSTYSSAMAAIAELHRLGLEPNAADPPPQDADGSS